MHNLWHNNETAPLSFFLPSVFLSSFFYPSLSSVWPSLSMHPSSRSVSTHSFIHPSLSSNHGTPPLSLFAIYTDSVAKLPVGPSTQIDPWITSDTCLPLPALPVPQPSVWAALSLFPPFSLSS